MNDFIRAWRHHPGGGGPWAEWTDQLGGGRGHRGGPPPWASALFGFQQPEPKRRGPRVRRGDVRSAILGVLAEAKASGEHVNGYQVIQQIAARSKDEWRPSPGSVYPTIQQLEDEGLIETDDAGGRRAIRLTAHGEAWVADHGDEIEAVWRPFADQDEPARGAEFGRTLKSEIGQVAGAVWQLATQGSEAQRAQALEVLVETRRRLYGILADGPEARKDHAQEAEDAGDFEQPEDDGR